MPKFQHILVTRFNLRVQDWSKTKNNEDTLTAEWMEHRFHLFRNYCLPSIKNQTDQDFKWLVYFDQSTSEGDRRIANQLAIGFPQLIPMFKKGMSGFLKTHKSDIESLLHADTTHVITSRLDNDDLLHKDFVKRLKKEAEPVKEQVIDARKGYQLLIESQKQEVRVKIARFNHFISVVEDRMSFRSGDV